MNRMQVKIPDNCFHITKMEHVQSTLEEGLVPGKMAGASKLMDAGEPERIGVYVASDWQILLQNMEDFVGELALLEVDMVGIKGQFNPDRAYDDNFDWTEQELRDGLYDQFSWFTKSSIPPERLKLLGKINGKILVQISPFG